MLGNDLNERAGKIDGIVRECRYSIHYIQRKNTFELKRTNRGFTPLELLGALDFIRNEIIQQIEGKIKPDIIQRNVIPE
jgi:hypothetical protein